MSSPCTLTIALVLLTSSQALAQLRLNDCRVSGEPIRCGTLRVPENRARSAGRQLVLSIVLASHSGSAESKEPLFVLKGGPGERATAGVEHTLGIFRRLRNDHDLVLLDQRGSGGEYALQCDVADHTFLVPRDP